MRTTLLAAILFASACLAAQAYAAPDACVTPPPPPPVGGSYPTCSAGNVPSGTTCVLACAAGYTKTGTDPQCFLGAYAGATNDCVPATCAPLSAPAGSSSDCGTAPTGSTCTVGCVAGHTGNTETATCVGTGVGTSAWQFPSVTCTPNACIPPPPPPTGGSYPACSAGDVPSGTTCVLACAAGYTKTGSDPECYLGAFSQTGMNDCVPATCAPLSASAGIASDCGSAPTGSTCTVGCASGYAGASPQTATCVGTAGGTSAWQFPSLTCTAHACGAPPTPPTGGSYPTCNGDSVPSGTTCALTCAAGYTKTGTDPQCTLGSFTGLGMNGCTPATCAPLSAPDGGSSSCGAAPTGSACTVSCDPGYTKVGADPVCVGTGIGTAAWQGSASCVTCAPSPAVGCRQPTKSGKALLKLQDAPSNEKDELQWTWNNGAATTLAEVGDPTTTDSYELCLYDAGVLRSTTRIPAGGTCAGKPCWKAKTKGFEFKSKDRSPDGVALLKLKEGLAGKAQLQLKGKGVLLEMPALGSALVGPVTVQLKRNGDAVCWEATYGAPFAKNDGKSFRDKSD